jgi:hypothetical protein
VIKRTLAMVAFAVLLLAPAASAKEVTRVLVVGADGQSVNVGGGWSLYDALRPANGSSPNLPSGRYLLVYPLMKASVPMQPARYYPDAGVGCWSWSLALEGCITSSQLPASWTATQGLAPFSNDPTILTGLIHGSRWLVVPSNPSIAVELALLRTQLARPIPTSPCRWGLRATWEGPAAASRPRSLCLRTAGLSVGNRLYPLSGTVTTMLRTW